jgi:hypothetical protein
LFDFDVRERHNSLPRVLDTLTQVFYMFNWGSVAITIEIWKKLKLHRIFFSRFLICYKWKLQLKYRYIIYNWFERLYWWLYSKKTINSIKNQSELWPIRIKKQLANTLSLLVINRGSPLNASSTNFVNRLNNSKSCSTYFSGS